MRQLFHTALFSVLAIVAASCDSTPSYVIAPDKMAEVMADIHTGEAVVESGSGSFHTDSARQALKQSILARHNVTLETFDTSLYWYGHNVEKFMEVNEKTIEILNHRIEEAQKLGNVATVVAKYSEEGDSVDIWNGPSMVMFTSKSPSTVLPFFFTSDRNWERGDLYTLNLKAIDNETPVKATIVAEYDDGTADYVSEELDGEGITSLRLYLDSARMAVNLYGQILYEPMPQEKAYVDSISLVRTRTKTNAPYKASSPMTVRYRE